MIKIDGSLALLRLTADCKFAEDRARRVLNIAWEFGEKAEPCPGGYVHVYYHGKEGGEHYFSVVEHLGPEAERKAVKGLAQPDGKRYTQRKQASTSGGSREGKDEKMARTAAAAKPAPAQPAKRGRKPAPAPEPEQNGDMNDEERGEAAQRYLNKPFTATMQDYVEWFETYVSELKPLPKDRILVLGIQLYGLFFQKSPFNRERTAERREERASAAPPEPEPAKPAARRGRPAAASTAAGNGTPARRGRTAAAKDEPAEPAKPAARRGRPPKAATEAPAAPARGRGRKPAATAGKDAPF
jgi:hypothetical protein